MNINMEEKIIYQYFYLALAMFFYQLLIYKANKAENLNSVFRSEYAFILAANDEVLVNFRNECELMPLESRIQRPTSDNVTQAY